MSTKTEIDGRSISAIDYDAAGRRLRAYCLGFRAAELRHLTPEQQRELAEGREVVVISPRGARTDLRAPRFPANPKTGE